MHSKKKIIPCAIWTKTSMKFIIFIVHSLPRIARLFRWYLNRRRGFFFFILLLTLGRIKPRDKNSISTHTMKYFFVQFILISDCLIVSLLYTYRTSHIKFENNFLYFFIWLYYFLWGVKRIECGTFFLRNCSNLEYELLSWIRVPWTPLVSPNKFTGLTIFVGFREKISVPNTYIAM